MALWDRVTALIAGGAVARGAADAVTPVLEPVRQTAWSKNRQRVLDVDTAARLVAQALISHGEADEEASRTGYSTGRLDALIALLQTAPVLGEIVQMLNRGLIDPDDFREALAKHQVDPKWWPFLLDLANRKLDPVQLANAIHRGLIEDPGLLAAKPPTGAGNVPSYPVYPIDALEEAKADGFDRDRLGVLVGLMGLPMGPIEAAHAFFRGILNQNDYDRAIAEGNTRNEWAEAILEYARQIPTARDFFENALRGYHDLAWAQEQAKRHGMSEDDSLVIYQNQGRPMSLTNIRRALARGGTFQPEPGEITEPFEASIVEGNLKPGYYDLARHLTYSYPSAFVFRQLAQEGVLGGQPEVKQWLLELGWPPELADKTATAWVGGTAGASSQVKSEQTRLRTATHKSYVAQLVDDAGATTALEAAGVAATDIPAILTIWQAERTLRRAELSPSDIRKAFQTMTENITTGQAWTHDEALSALLDRGWRLEDAENYLLIAYKG